MLHMQVDREASLGPASFEFLACTSLQARHQEGLLGNSGLLHRWSRGQ